jgi:hypothetical protein
MLLVVLPATWEQTSNELSMVGGTYLKLEEYYGEFQPNGTFQGPLTCDHPLFDTTKRANKKTVILTTLKKLSRRHEPAPSRAKRVRDGMLAKQADAADLQPLNPLGQWDHDLHELFDLVIVDEAHLVKNFGTAGHATISWLQPQFTVLAIGTPAPNRVDDFLECRHYYRCLEAHEVVISVGNVRLCT